MPPFRLAAVLAVAAACSSLVLPGAATAAPAKAPALPGAAPVAPLGTIAAAGRAPAATGEIIVRYRPGAQAADRRAARARAQAGFERSMRVARSQLLQVDRGRTVAAALAELRRDPAVAFAVPNHYRYLHAFTPNDGDWYRMWGLHNTGSGVDGASASSDADIDAPEAWDVQRGSASVTVAVVDTGIKAGHTDLDGNVGPGWDFIDGDAVPQDLDGHGTHVAGTIGAEGHNGFGTVGVAHDVTLMPLRVFGVDGATTDDLIADAFDYAADSGADVVNASLGGAGGGAIYEAVVRDNPGALYVVSAGNGGDDGIGDNNETTPQYPCNVTQPNLICVAASTQTDARAGFSNFGATSVDIAAPGTQIWSTWPSVTQLYQDTFEFSPLPYTTGGTGATWGYQNSAALNFTPNGSWVLSDSPGGAYAANSSAWAQRNVVSLQGLSNCALGFRGYLVTEPGYDFLVVEASRGAGAWSELARYTSFSAAQIERVLAEDLDLASYGGASEFWLRFRLISDGDNASISGNPGLDGAMLDQVTLKCANGTGQYINPLQGTSMASPHVAGAAALVLSQRPDLSPTRVKAAIMDNGDPSTIPTVSGRRLNAYGALLEFVAPSGSITSGPPALTTSRSATFFFTDDQVGSRYECMLDSGPWQACASGKSYVDLAHGQHTFRLRTINRSGTVDPTEERHEWIVDLQAPDTSIHGTPSSPTGASTATFTYSSTETGAGFQCSLDGGSFTSCSASGRTYSGLGSGTHTFAVRSVDRAGNVDPTPAEHAWTVDVTPAETTLTAGPSGATTATAAAFAFTSEAGATFECRLDAAAWTPCSSPHELTGLEEGDHTFAVRATDALGNTDPTPAERAFRVDLTPPDTTFTSGPSGPTASASVAFAFGSSEPGSSFQCRLDEGAWAGCASPVSLHGLAEGPHTFAVRATDAAGLADPTPATRAFTVDTVAPDTAIVSGPSGTTGNTTATFAFTSTEEGASFECRLGAGAWETCASPESYTGLADGAYEFAVRAIDAAGNADASAATRAFTVDTSIPPDTDAPDTVIDAGPSGPTNDASPEFAFSSSEAGSSFECRLDGGPWEAGCVSPQTYSGLADGEHEFAVRAADAAGNVDASEAVRSFVVDTVAPHTSITAGPAGAIAERSATFTFDASEPGATFECSLDGAAWAACASPASFGGLGDGAHAFAVRATDAAGNVEGAPPSRSFTVAPAAVTDPPPVTGGGGGDQPGTGHPPVHPFEPLLTVGPAFLVDPRDSGAKATPGTGAPGIDLGRRRASIGTMHALEDVEVQASLKAILPKGRKAAASGRRTLGLGRRKVRVPAGNSVALSVRVSKKAARKLRRAKRVKVTATVSVRSLATGTVTKGRRVTTLKVARR